MNQQKVLAWILQGDVLKQLATLADESVQCVVTSPPYWGLRDYGIEGQLGLEKTPEEYLGKMVVVFREIRRVLRKDGTCWLNMGDSYCGYKGDNYMVRPETSQLQSKSTVPKAHEIGTPQTSGLKPKDLCGIPWRLALALQADGWWLRSDIIWSKLNPMPESVTDRPTSSHEYIFLLTKSGAAQYWTHRDLVGTRKHPAPDYRWIHGETGEEVQEEPANWRDKDSPWKRINLWRGHDYYYDAEAVREPHHQDGRSITTVMGKGGSLQHRDGERWPNSGRNLRSVWNISTQPYPDAHFATFPEKLVARCILAGTSEKGACECGAPWARVVDVKNPPKRKENRRTSPGQTKNTMPLNINDAVPSHKTLDWRPTCECGRQDVRPCVVLDPFIGSGTVGKVAQDLGRDWIGIELSPDYCEMARKRTMRRQERLSLL